MKSLRRFLLPDKGMRNVLRQQKMCRSKTPQRAFGNAIAAPDWGLQTFGLTEAEPLLRRQTADLRSERYARIAYVMRNWLAFLFLLSFSDPNHIYFFFFLHYFQFMVICCDKISAIYYCLC